MPSIREQLAADAVKPFETVNHDNDNIEAAKKAARDRRNGANRQLASELSKDYFEKNIRESLKNFEDKTGITTGVANVAMTTDEGVVTETKVTEQPRANNGQFAAADVAEELDDDSLSIKVTRTVNGKKVSKTVKEWLETAEKVETADEYLTEAARARASVNAPRPQPQPAPLAFDKDTLVKAIQEGSKEEAADAIDKIVAQAGLNAQQSLSRAQFDTQLLESLTRVRQANPDVANDVLLWDRACRLEGAMNPHLSIKFQGVEKQTFDAQNPVKDFEMRLQSAVEQTRKWVEGMKGTGAAQERKQQLTLKKKQMASVSGANGTAVGGEPETTSGPFGKTFKSAQEYNEHVAREMQRKRKTRLE